MFLPIAAGVCPEWLMLVVNQRGAVILARGNWQWSSMVGEVRQNQSGQMRHIDSVWNARLWQAMDTQRYPVLLDTGRPDRLLAAAPCAWCPDYLEMHFLPVRWPELDLDLHPSWLPLMSSGMTA